MINTIEMAEKDSTKAKEDAASSFVEKFSVYINAFLIVATLIGNYYVGQYRTENNEKEIEKLHAKVAKIEDEVNYELLSKQLEDIKDATKELNEKVANTNRRVDDVLKILVANNK